MKPRQMDKQLRSLKGLTPPSLKRFLASVQGALPQILGANLIGIYLHGSLAYGDFNAHRSDVDVAVVVRRSLTSTEFTKLDAWFNGRKMRASPWRRRLEMDFFRVGQLIPPLQNTLMTARFAGGRLKKSALFEGAAIELRTLHDCGVALYGPSPKAVFPNVSAKLIRAALKEKFVQMKKHAIAWAQPNLWFQTFVVFQLCRIIHAAFNNGEPNSKKSATQWCARNAPESLRPMIKLAAKRMDDFKRPRERLIDEKLPKLIEYAGRVVKCGVLRS